MRDKRVYRDKMKRLHTLIILVVTTLTIINTACIEDDFTSSSGDTLTFSTDTLAFDTIFTAVGTATHKFTVYNRHSKMINISSIKINGESKAKFYLNVDGVKGNEFNNVEIRSKDSIFVFVEAYIDPTDKNNPIELKDKIEFITNGVTQDIVLTAWGQDVKREHATVISKNTTFTAERPYVIFDTLHIEKDATLTLEPGANLYFHDKGAMKIDGKLIANGTQEKPINLRGDRLDKVVGGISYDIMSGQWGGITFTSDSYENEMQYVLMRGSTTGVTIDSCNIDRRKLHIYNSVLHNSSNSVLLSKHAWIDAEGTEFSDAKNSVVNLTGGKITFVHCTIANYYLFSAISGALLSVDYIMPKDQKEIPLMVASFNNCVIYGNAGDISNGNLEGSNVFLRSCLLKSSGTDDSNFINCTWKSDPMFYTVREDYIFDYRLRNKSEAIAKGDVSLCPQSLKYDRYGIDRFSREGIDIGAYTWVPAKDEETDKK